MKIYFSLAAVGGWKIAILTQRARRCLLSYYFDKNTMKKLSIIKIQGNEDNEKVKRVS